jgi:hypothetical protein
MSAYLGQNINSPKEAKINILLHIHDYAYLG